MDEHQNLPDINQLSVLAATILLAYAFTPFIQIPERSLSIQLPGFFFVARFEFATLISVLVAGLAAAGSSWLVHSHPHAGQTRTFQHWILPALTAWAIGIPLDTLALGPSWWAVFAFGGLLLILVFVAEYIVVDISDTRLAPATAALTAVSFALYLTMSIALCAAGVRLYTLVPTLASVMGLVALRTLYLRLNGRWCWTWALAIALVAGQFAMGLHYLPLSPLRFGMFLVGPAYALTSLAEAIQDQREPRTLWIEPLLMLLAFWLVGFLIG